jgi:regulator of ribosome biosynthesis
LASAAHHCLDAPLLLLLLQQPGEDPFTLLRQEKKERQKKQNKQQLANVKQAIKTGGAAAVPATLRLAATLPDKGKGKPTKRRELRDEVSQQFQSALAAEQQSERPL